MSEQKTILCVDDEVDILELFKDEFEENGYKVLQADCGNKGFEVYKANKVDCIVSDIRMANGDGATLVKNVKEAGGNIPIFLVTGFSDYTSDELAGLGVSAIIFKPFDLEEVVKMVSNTIEKPK
jgi:two-component system response regulator FlrC